MDGFITEARRSFHAALLEKVLSIDASGVPSNADRHNATSRTVAMGIMHKVGAYSEGSRLAGQMSGHQFEIICARFIADTFGQLSHLRPGLWNVQRVSGRDRLQLSLFDQYTHLRDLDRAAREYPALAAALGSDYTIVPDIVVSRSPEPDVSINSRTCVVDAGSANLTPLRQGNGGEPLLHASISCKWTIRSDRVQNARSEGLNLVKNRKGRLPHIMVIVGEPLPSRIASIALGTGEIDCVYHFALPELESTLEELGQEEARELLRVMVEGKRLRDIADIPLDLAV